MAGTTKGDDRSNLPRTDLPPKKLPYDDDYFGTGEEQRVEKEREATDRDRERPPDGGGSPA